MHYIHFLLVEVLFVTVTYGGNNLTCYQCINYENVQCGNESLRPCPSASDRCVTHISKDEQKGYVIKRECGLGPCGFEDDMVNKGLGLGGGCDRHKDEYFCVYCCKTNGCNKNETSAIMPNYEFISGLILIILAVYFKNFGNSGPDVK